MIATVLRTAIVPVLLALAVLPTDVIAQLESGVRPLTREGFGGDWYSSARAMFQILFPIIRSMPPLDSGMPWDVMAGYIVADSIARFDRTKAVPKLIRSWDTPNDTLRGLLKCLYRMGDYNPLIFTQYGVEVSHGWGGRKGKVMNMYNEAHAALPRIAAGRTEARALNAAMYAGNVLRVRVTAIDSMPFRYQPKGWDSKVMYRATVQVLDTLKGPFLRSRR